MSVALLKNVPQSVIDQLISTVTEPFDNYQVDYDDDSLCITFTENTPIRPLYNPSFLIKSTKRSIVLKIWYCRFCQKQVNIDHFSMDRSIVDGYFKCVENPNKTQPKLFKW